MEKVIREIPKLSLFLFFLLFLSGRFGLLLHEFAGHALFCRLSGGEVTEFRLFVFGGGWVLFGWPPAAENLSASAVFFVYLSGIATELAVGAILAFFAIFFRASRLVKAWLSSASSVLLVHGLFYLVLCTYYGSGDGRIIFDTFHGNLRHWILTIIFCLNIGVAFWVSFEFSPLVKSWTADCRMKNRYFLIVSSIAVAVMLHGALAVSERNLAKDRIYAKNKTSVNDRMKEDELTRFIEEYTEEHGRKPDQEEVNAFADELEKKYRQFPIEIPLCFLVLVAFLAGFFLSDDRKYGESNPVKWKDNWVLGSASVLTALLIVGLNTV